MRITLLDQLICPNTHKPGFTAFAAKLRRGDETLTSVEHSAIGKEDEIVEGLLITADEQYAYPIRFDVLSMLSDEDIDLREYHEHLEALRPNLSPRFLEVGDRTAARLVSRQTSEDGDWNREEMKYYDSEVDTPEKRAAMCADIANTYLPHIFLPRQKHVIGPLLPAIEDKTVVEIGCGNARTITRLMPPGKHNYRYIGSDIAFWRLVVAKTVCPDGEFIQASAFNLPLATACAEVGISFGMLHHLPRPAEGLKDLHRSLKADSYLALHEPVVTKKILADRYKKLEALLQTYEHSDHDGEVDIEDFCNILNEMGYQVLRHEFLASPFRAVAETIANRLNGSILRSKVIYKVLFAVDRLCIRSICRVSNLFAPRGVILLAMHR